MKRISVTTLEKFRRYVDNVSSFDTEESLIESLQGLFKGNDKTFFGSAYHLLIEGKFQNYGGTVYVKDGDNDFVFNTAQAKPALDYRARHTAMMHEMTVRKIYNTHYGPIQVTGRLDGVEGMFVHDAKCRFKPMDDEDYRDSFQWRLYLDMTDAETFVYDVFEIKGFEQLPEKKPFILPGVEIIAHDPVQCDRYEDMSNEVQSLLNLFMSYIDVKGFTGLLKPAIQDDIFSL